MKTFKKIFYAFVFATVFAGVFGMFEVGLQTGGSQDRVLTEKDSVLPLADSLLKSDFRSLLLIAFFGGLFLVPQITNAAPFDATNFMTLFLHSEAPDANSTYNTLSLTPSEPTAYTSVGSAVTMII